MNAGTVLEPGCGSFQTKSAWAARQAHITKFYETEFLMKIISFSKNQMRCTEFSSFIEKF